MQAIPLPLGQVGYVTYVGVPQAGVELQGEELFFSHVHLHGGPAPVRPLPTEAGSIWSGRKRFHPGKGSFDLTLPLDQVAEGPTVQMDERRAIQGHAFKP